MQKVTTFLWFDDQAEQAAEFYTSLPPDSRILEVQRHGGRPGAGGFVDAGHLRAGRAAVPGS